MRTQNRMWMWILLTLLICPTANAQNRIPNEFNQKTTLKVFNLPLTTVVKFIASNIQYNVVLGPGVEDRNISVDVQDVSIAHALNTLLYSAGYGFKVQGHDVIILAEETRIFRVVLPPVVGQFSDVTSNESSSSSSQQVKVGAKTVVESGAQGISFWDDVRDNLKMLVSKTGGFSINKPGGMVIVTESPGKLERIRQYFEDLNRRVTQQIQIDVKVVEVTLNKENKLGVDWNALAGNLKTFNSLGMSSNFASGNFTSGQFLTFNADGSKPGSGVTANGFRLAIDALSKQGKVEVVSQPRVMILNNQVAVIQVGSTQSYIDHSTLETTQTGTISSLSTAQVQEGVTMRLLGNIVRDRIYLSVTPVVTTIDHIRSIISGNTTIEAPQTTTKSINTMVKLKQGETVAIGGLITSHVERSKQGVPLISKIPMLGKLFQYSQDKRSKTELVIFITPKRG